MIVASDSVPLHGTEATRLTAPPDEFHILFVCTGNICRSPFAELVTRHVLAPPAVTVTSAGCHALLGHGVDPLTRTELARWGVPGPAIAAHAARQVDPDMLGRADLILTAERTHRAHLATMHPQGLRRTFCLREFHRLLTAARPYQPVSSIHDMVAIAAAARGMIPSVPAATDAIADPHGQPAGFHQTCANTIATLLRDILTSLVPA